MFGNQFYHTTTKRLVAVFGTIFNDIKIDRNDNDGNFVQRMKVPISYGPHQKFLSRVEQDPDFQSQAIRLPRMSFELVSLTYDPARKLTSTLVNRSPITSNPNAFATSYVPVPYNLEFQLSIMAKNVEDGTKIVEQILPFFKPDFTPSVRLLDEQEIYMDIPVILNSVSYEDNYENDYLTRRAIIWTLTFTMKAYYFGPTTTKKVIKFTRVNFHETMNANSQPSEWVTVQPGLTANGEPTTELSETIPFNQIDFEDDWDFIVRIEDA